MGPTDARSEPYDVAIVGGGPAGCSAGIFTARYGLRTVVFDRGQSSLRRCAFLENYLGFPAGIGVDTFYELIHRHVTDAGCDLRPELVAETTRDDGQFTVQTADDRTVAAERVVAATKCGAPYLAALDEPALFDPTERGDSPALDLACIEWDGRTPVDGLYVAGPLAGVGDQAIIAAGHGAVVARSLITDIRRDKGYWDEIAEPYDWVRRDAELRDEWRNRDRWHEWFDTHSEPDDLSAAAIRRIRDAYIDRSLEMYVSDDEVARKRQEAQREIASQLDDTVLLDVLDDERLREYAEEQVGPAGTEGADPR